MPSTNRPGRISSSAEPVIASTTGWRVNGLAAPSATRKPASSPSPSAAMACAIAVVNVTPSRSK